MRVVSHTLTNEDSIKIVPLADLHIGSSRCDIPRIKHVIDTIVNDPRAYVVLVGDIINNSTKTSVGDVYEEKMSPMEQCKLAVDILRPIADKILGAVCGNHEQRTRKDSGVDLMYFIADELGIPEVYNPEGVVSLVRFGKKIKANGTRTCLSMYITHGDKIGGATIGGKMNGLEKRGNIFANVDLVIVGHTHTPSTFKTSQFLIDERNNSILTKETTFVNTGAWLEYEPYAERCGLKPSSTAMPVIYVYPKTHHRGNGGKKLVVHLG